MPRTAAPLTIDGELDESSWLTAARSGPFQSGGQPAHPYSDARFLWHGDTLYIALYAADEDIRASMTEHDAPLWTEDAFHLVFAHAELDVAPNGTITDARRTSSGALDFAWQSGARAATELDGTPNDPNDDDEEWLVELAVPLQALGVSPVRGAEIPLTIQRCDRPKNAARTCASVSLRLALGGGP